MQSRHVSLVCDSHFSYWHTPYETETLGVHPARKSIIQSLCLCMCPACNTAKALDSVVFALRGFGIDLHPAE
jgi:hypothetical protein